MWKRAIQGFPRFHEEESGGGGDGGGAGDAAAAAAAGDAGADQGGGNGGSSPAGIFKEEGSLEFRENWYDGIESLKGHENYLQQFSSFDKMVQSGRDFMSKYREKTDHLLEIPSEESPEEVVAAYREKMGIPDAPEKYEIKPDDGIMPEGSEIEAEKIKAFEAFAAETGAPKELAQKMFNYFLKADIKEFETLQHQEQQEAQEAEKHLQETWGRDYEKKSAQVKHLANEFGMAPEDQEALKIPGVAKLLGAIAGRVQEGKVTEELGTPTDMSFGAQAKSIIHDKSNAQYDAYHNGSHPDNKMVREKVRNLLKQSVDSGEPQR